MYMQLTRLLISFFVLSQRLPPVVEVYTCYSAREPQLFQEYNMASELHHEWSR